MSAKAFEVCGRICYSLAVLTIALGVLTAIGVYQEYGHAGGISGCIVPPVVASCFIALVPWLIGRVFFRRARTVIERERD